MMNAGGISLIFAIQIRLAALFSLPNLTWSNFFHLDSGWKFPLSLTIFGIAVALMGSGGRIQVKSNPLDTYLPKQVRD
jgi:hypothetical protein